jgi:hypothetical protein
LEGAVVLRSTSGNVVFISGLGPWEYGVVQALRVKIQGG